MSIPTGQEDDLNRFHCSPTPISIQEITRMTDYLDGVLKGGVYLVPIS
jgi:hypothetical protein